MRRNRVVALLAAACICAMLGGVMRCASAAPVRAVALRAVALRAGGTRSPAAAARGGVMRLGGARVRRVLASVVKRVRKGRRGAKHKVALSALTLRKSDEEDGEHDDADEDEDDDDADDDDDEESEAEAEEDGAEPEAQSVGVAKTIRTAADSGGAEHVVDGVNVTHISYMIFKIIKANKIRSVVDMPCRNSLQWFPPLLQRIDFELGDFKYYCVDTEGDARERERLRQHFSDAGNPEFLHMKPDAAHAMPRADLVFSWGGPQQWGVRNTWAFFTALRSVRPKFLMITNNPTVTNANDHDGTLNLRKQPFHFAKAMRVISDVTVGDVPKQLLLYKMDGIRAGF